MALAPRRRQPGTLDPTEEVVRLLAVMVRLQVRTQAAAVAELSRAGFGPTRIATLLGTTPETVNTDLRRSKQRSGKRDDGD